MALVIAASVFMGDLIAALAYLLRGELTSLFLAKSFVVLALSSGVFWYYFGGLRKIEVAAGRFSRDRIMAVTSAVVVVALIVLSFMQLGAPSAQRRLVADSQRLQRLYSLSNSIRTYWQGHSSQLPTSLAQIPGTYTDPVTHASFEYHPAQGSQYRLCAAPPQRGLRRLLGSRSDPVSESLQRQPAAQSAAFHGRGHGPGEQRTGKLRLAGHLSLFRAVHPLQHGRRLAGGPLQ